MLEGKFKCIKSSDSNLMKEGKVYTFIKGICKCENGIESLPHRTLEEWNNNPSDDFKLEPYSESNYLTNAGLWLAVELGEVKDGDIFSQNGDTIIYKDGVFYTDTLTFGEVEFRKGDKWIKLSSIPKLTRKQAESEFNIEIID